MSLSFDEETVDHLTDFSVHLWLLALVFFGAGDLLTTAVGIRFERTVEVGPLASTIVQYGVGPLVALKIVSIGLCGLLWRVAPRPHRVGVPLGLAALGVLVSLWNLSILFAVLASG